MAVTNRNNSRSVAAPASVAAGAATDVADFSPNALTVYLLSAGTATYQLQVSPDGTNWVDLGSALTTSGYVAVNIACLKVRWNCTAWTNGTPTSLVVGGPQ